MLIEDTMKTLDLTINVPEGRVITVKLPEDISPGEHRVVMVIDQTSPEKPSTGRHGG